MCSMISFIANRNHKRATELVSAIRRRRVADGGQHVLGELLKVVVGQRLLEPLEGQLPALRAVDVPGHAGARVCQLGCVSLGR